MQVKYFGDFKKLFLRVMYQSRLCTYRYSFVYLYSALHVGMCTNLEGWLYSTVQQRTVIFILDLCDLI